MTYSTEVRDWNALMPGTVHLYNAYKDRKSKDPVRPMRVPQSFTFLRREGWFLDFFLQQSFGPILHNHFIIILTTCFPLADLPGHGQGMMTEERVPKRLRVAGDATDVFCLVKMNMCDSGLCQDPLLVYPAGLGPGTSHFWGRISSATQVIHAELDDERKQQLATLAQAMKKDFPHLQRAVDYYGGLVDDNRPRQKPPVLKFVEAGPNARARIGNVQLGQRPPPPKPYHLKVKFHRA